jgi:DNA-binding PadR family transcriptional regulator
MRRRRDVLLPIEQDILSAALELRRRETREFFGFRVARAIQSEAGARALVAHGTLYKALGRLEDLGFLTSRWENPTIAEADGRPRRRLYQVTAAGQHALAAAAVATKRHGRRAAVRPLPSWR